MLIRVVCCIILSCSCLFASKADAHRLGESYLFLKIYDNTIEGHLEILLSDLDNAVSLEADRDGKITEEEFDAKIDTVKSYISDRLALGTEESPYRIQFTTHEVRRYKYGQFAVIHFFVESVQDIPQILGVSYSILFDVDPKHRGIVILGENKIDDTNNEAGTTGLIFSPQRQRQELDLTISNRSRGFVAFVKQGIRHIWIGVDHILFLIALVLPSVLRKDDNRLEPVANFRPAFMTVVKIVSLFTIAHSITLSLAALGLIELPSRLIESVIAASVVLAALNNLFPIFADRAWLIIFGFGLFHGFGFATVLSHLGLQRGSLIGSLFGFNLGVELGQIAIISIAFPTFYILRLLRKFYPYVILKFGSATVMLIALLWLIERAFELDSIIGIF